MAANGQLNLGLRCIKYLLCAINALFMLTGVMIVSVGTTIYAVYENFSQFLSPSYASPATILIIVGALVFIISFFGCCGALKESTCMVLVFAVSLSIVLILELAATITAYAMQDAIMNATDAKLVKIMENYPTNENCRQAIDFLQSNQLCCGFNNSKDWTGILSNRTEVPKSCCQSIIFESSHGDKCYPYSVGCYDRLVAIISHSVLYIGTAALAIALVQLTGIMFACVLGRAIRRQKTERERRRIEFRENIINGYQPVGKSDPLSAFPVVYMQPTIDSRKPSIMS